MEHFALNYETGFILSNSPEEDSCIGHWLADSLGLTLEDFAFDRIDDSLIIVDNITDQMELEVFSYNSIDLNPSSLQPRNTICGDSYG